MKLIDLFEDVETDNVALAKKIKRDCEFYFSQVKNSNLHLYRGSESENMVHGAFRKFKARTRPLDTPLKFHTELNRYFKAMYGRPFRNGLFVTGSVDVWAAFNASKSPPACLTASSTASSMAFVVIDAPDTESTAKVWFLIIASIVFLNASSEMPSVSECSMTVIVLISFSVNSTSTLMFPFLPAATPVYLPAL